MVWYRYVQRQIQTTSSSNNAFLDKDTEIFGAMRVEVKVNWKNAYWGAL
jgi:hypothetical protein